MNAFEGTGRPGPIEQLIGSLHNRLDLAPNCFLSVEACNRTIKGGIGHNLRRKRLKHLPRRLSM
jgi:hypothetical protein